METPQFIIWVLASLISIELMMVSALTDMSTPLAPRSPEKLFAALVALRITLLVTIVIAGLNVLLTS